MLRVLTQLRSFWLFGASVLLTKSMSLVTIPLTTGRLSPSDYGRLELVASIVEAFGIVMTLGLADSLFRFGGGEPAPKQRDVIAGLTGMALTLALAAGAALQVAVWTLAPRLGLSTIVVPLSIGLFAATLSGLIELPLAWLRLRGRAGAFLLFTCSRTLIQVAVMAVTLRAGFGIVGLLAGNASVDAMIAATLLTLQIRDCGIRFDRATFARAGRYGLPLIGGALSMFVLGSCDRWFLAGVVAPSELGFYGLAAKLSAITILAMQPFGLWWYAQRIGYLKKDGGLEASARAIGVGMILLAAGAAATCIGAPLLVYGLLPSAYRAALPFLPWLVLAVSLNELCSLLNVGAYARSTGYQVLAVNTCGAAVALTGYILLTPTHGVWGAIAATIAAHCVRLTLYLVVGRSAAPIPYPLGLAGILFALVVALVLGMREASGAATSVFLVAAAAVALGYMIWRVAGREMVAVLRERPA
jgi:O-antigen/teichoic acid export membrane protein